ncbi:hypothetical protein RD110_18765 [Rhodoferax koreense]|uniref:ASCH domain-containing protein n=1 Tax=Rhodoferax koreensis TaxID=1842727 RepID=A0A1P8JZ16_9BURK|nr:ASCH domain-containing protein [Rhodoferax koreense]APW38997.1 hypothetical protein RD110_18765 [Rhodoferax koreense]
MKALSVRQPWAWLIVNGYKPVENRTWETLYRGPVLMHASKTMTAADFEACQIFLASDPLTRHLVDVLPQPLYLPRGGIVGRADVVACQRAHESPFFVGPFGHVLANARPLPFTPLTGRLGYFNASGVWS